MLRTGLVLVFLGFVLSTGGCKYPLLENVTIANTKAQSAVKLPVPGKKVEGNAYYPYMVGYSFHKAVKRAFKKAGPRYDLLVNTKVTVKYYYVLLYWSTYVIVRGTAVSSKELIARWGDAKYQAWLRGQPVMYRSGVMR